MKHFFLIIFLAFTIAGTAAGQATLPDTCHVTGYFFHSEATSRPIDMVKAINKIGINRYEVVLGDLAAYKFQFDINIANQLVNWTAAGTTPAAPSSGFMTQDNPGGFSFPVPGTEYPGGGGSWNTFEYTNTYDPVTKVISMHYGYAVGSTGQTGYTRQVYEKWKLPAPRIISFTPSSGTALSEISIKVKYLSPELQPAGLSFGGIYADSLAIVSDSVLKGWVSYGGSDKIKVANAAGTDSADGFTFIPVPPVIDTQWRYLGAPGFSDSWSPFVNIACGSNNTPHVVYRDSASGKTIVKKYSGGTWINVGGLVSDGKCSNTNMLMDNNNNPVVVYQDSANSNKLTVKRFNGSAWTVIGTPGFALWDNFSYLSPSIATDAANNIYVLSIDSTEDEFGSTVYSLSLYKFSGTAWTLVGSPGFAVSYKGVSGLAIDKLTNTPYVAYDISTGFGNVYPGQASVMKYNGSAWVQVGQPRITSGYRGIYYTDIAVDRTGVPYISMQDDDGYERTSVFKLSGASWVPVGNPKFSNGHTFYSSLVLDSSNHPLVLYRDESYNRSGTVMTWNNTGSWKYVGLRGFGPSQYYDQNSLAIDGNNIPMIAFGDYRHQGKVSVMAFIQSREINDSLCAGGNISFTAENINAGNIYRWQGNNGSGFNNLVNNAVYNGVTTGTLNLQNVPSAYYGYQYRGIIQNGAVTDTGFVHVLKFVNRWTGAVSSAWENPGNWSCNVVPDANTDVIVNNGTITVSSNVTIRSLYTGVGVNISITSGNNMTILH